MFTKNHLIAVSGYCIGVCAVTVAYYKYAKFWQTPSDQTNIVESVQKYTNT